MKKKTFNPKNAREYISIVERKCPYVVKTYNPPYVLHFTCFYFKNMAGDEPCFKKPCMREDYFNCVYNPSVMREVQNIVTKRVAKTQAPLFRNKTGENRG